MQSALCPRNEQVFGHAKNITRIPGYTYFPVPLLDHFNKNLANQWQRNPQARPVFMTTKEVPQSMERRTECGLLKAEALSRQCRVLEATNGVSSCFQAPNYPQANTTTAKGERHLTMSPEVQQIMKEHAL
jgi:hypothetical protein